MICRPFFQLAAIGLAASWKHEYFAVAGVYLAASHVGRHGAFAPRAFCFDRIRICEDIELATATLVAAA